MRIHHLAVVASALLLSSPASAVTPKQWDTAGTVVEVGLVAGAFGLSAARDDWHGVKDLAFTLAAAGGTAYALKYAIDEQRPDGSDNHSFPSGHTTIAFSAAGYIHARYGWKLGVPAAIAAGFVGFTRVQSNQHHWYDVVAGAAIGEGAAFIFTKPWNDQVQIIPWGDSKGGGVTLNARF
jgi:membrane-associated phospholipid phosphatase